MKKQNILAILCILLLTACSTDDESSGQGNPCEENMTAEGISVTVKSNVDQSGLQGATVIITSSDNEYTGLTGSNGIYFVRDIEAGFYEVRAEKTCFQPLFENVNVDPCEGEEKIEITLVGSNFITPTQQIYSGSQNEKSVTINNCHGEKVTWAATPDRSWITVFPQTGSIDASGGIGVSIQIDRTQLDSNNNYEGKVFVTLSSFATSASVGSDNVDISVAN